MNDDQPSALQIDSHTLRYITAGDPSAPPLLMIHGWMLHKGVWRTTIDALKDRYFCVALDLLGLGESDKPSDADYGIEAQGRRVLALADALGLDRFTLIGHSMGGQIALCVASMLAPERVEKVVSVDGVVTARLMPYVERFNYPALAIAARLPLWYTLWGRLVQFPPYARFHFRGWFHDMGALPFDFWETERRMATQPGIHVTALRCGQGIHGLDLTPHLPDIQAPALAIFGGCDAIVPVGDGELLAERAPHGRLTLIEDCSHFPMFEQPAPYLETLTAFLANGH